MSPEEVVEAFKNNDITAEEALDILGDMMLGRKKAELAQVQAAINSIIGIDEEPKDELDEATKEAWEKYHHG